MTRSLGHCQGCPGSVATPGSGAWPRPPAAGEGQSSVPSPGTAWSCRNPSRGAELPLTASGCHLQPCRSLAPLPVPYTQEAWLLELSGNWELYCPGDFAGNGLGRCHHAAVLPPEGVTKEPLLPCSPLGMAVMRNRIWSGGFYDWTEVASSLGMLLNSGCQGWGTHCGPNRLMLRWPGQGHWGHGCFCSSSLLLIISRGCNSTHWAS